MTFPRKGGRGLKGRFGSDVPPRPSKPSPSLRQYPFTLPCLQCDYSNRGPRKKTIKSQGFLKTKDSRFFANGTIEFKVQLCNRWKLLNRLNLPDVSGKGTQIYECFRSRFAKKNLRIFCFQKKLWLDDLPSAPVRAVALWDKTVLVVVWNTLYTWDYRFRNIFFPSLIWNIKKQVYLASPRFITRSRHPA